MDIDRNFQSLGPRQYRFEHRIVEEASIRWTVGQETVKTKVFYRSFQLARRRIRRKHWQMRKALVSVRVTGGRFKQCIVIVLRQRDALGTGDDVGSWTRDREHLHGDPARIHVRKARFTQVGKLAALDGLTPDHIRPGETAAANGSRIDAADNGWNGVVLFQRDDAHGASPCSFASVRPGFEICARLAFQSRRSRRTRYMRLKSSGNP